MTVCRTILKNQLEKTDKVTGKDVFAFLPPVFVQEFSAPPAILRGMSHSDNITRLEIKLLLDGSTIIIKGFHYKRSDPDTDKLDNDYAP